MLNWAQSSLFSANKGGLIGTEMTECYQRAGIGSGWHRPAFDRPSTVTIRRRPAGLLGPARAWTHCSPSRERRLRRTVVELCYPRCAWCVRICSALCYSATASPYHSFVCVSLCLKKRTRVTFSNNSPSLISYQECLVQRIIKLILLQTFQETW